MARQTGIIKLKGTIGDISFYKTSDGHLAREKGGIDKSRMANDPAFQRTRENGSEFGRAGKGGKLVRSAIRILLLNAKDMDYLLNMGLFFQAAFLISPFNFNSISRGVIYPKLECNLSVLYQFI